MNVLLGIPAVVPVWMLYYLAVTWVHSAPEENDGFGVVLILLGPLVAACGFLWWAANVPCARRTQLHSAQYWALSLLGMLLPSAALFTNSSVGSR
ncbi:hypothetical protein AB0B50_38440 [Streptomyces sp. NPDC041068]|uniref:hypothetical protein n=1 Tax=Streptomyces sp. NPDC041068 TaxID=3155130 RepID=UPI00340BA25E